MILQELHAYFERLHAANLAPDPGFSVQKISHALVIDALGRLVAFQDLRNHEGRTPQARPMPVFKPLGERSGTKAPSYFMWDRAKYVFGVELDAKGQRTLFPKAHEDFRKRQLRILHGVDDPGAEAMRGFIENCTPQTPFAIDGHEDVLAGGYLVFRLEGQGREFLHERPAIADAWLREYASLQSEERAQCLVTGEPDAPVTRIHPMLKGIQGAQSSGASMVGFNADSFGSYGKGASNLNAPVSEHAAFGYTTALACMLAKDSPQKVQVGDTAVVFWTARPSAMPEAIASLLGQGLVSLDEDAAPEQAPPHAVEKIRDLRLFLEAIRKGRKPHDLEDGDTPFFILGLAPNAARISVRFWHVSTVQGMSERVGRHLRDMALIKNYTNEPDCPPLWALVKETAAQRKFENIPPQLGGQLLRAVFTGGRYPESLVRTLMGRIRADTIVNYLRCAMLKAWLARNRNKEIPVALDKNKTETPYLLGRLFALYERAQELAIPEANATIKDRYYGAAAATPARVFVTLEKNCANHIAKLRKTEKSKGTAHWLQKEIADVVAEIQKFPNILAVEDQAEFILGYYQQRKDLFTKHETEPEAAQEEE